MLSQTNLYSTTLHKSVKPRLNELIHQAECLQMSVAYWTISETYFSSDLVKLLTKKDSFACIDISHPTNITEVCKIADSTNNNIYFYTKSLVKDNSQEQTSYMANHLLHSKILLFDLPDKKASIWIGSHNWTNRALSGINIETSVEILVDRNEIIYQQVKDLLVKIKHECHKVNSELEEVYKNVQRQENSWLYLDSKLDEKNISTDLTINTKIVFHLLFDHDNPENINNSRKIFLFLRNSINPNSGCLFEGAIDRSGRLPRIAPELNFPTLENGYYCFQQNDCFTNFKHIVNLTEKEKKYSCYYATIVTNSKKNITSIEEFLSEYKPAITIDKNIVNLKIICEESLSLWSTENTVTIEEPIINSNSKVDDYMSKITPEKIAKVTKKKKTD
ncbi:hypothetical protein QUA54_27700 [Microcoleus sp. MOSTC5]|uniref:hypothetical protein n=1 Tax=Microcoleus sp. MOSTC5 TaxID=3055378 RepID=UPI002FD02B59